MSYTYYATINGVTYTERDIVDSGARILRRTFDSFGIGNVASAELDLEVWPKGPIPDGAEVKIYARDNGASGNVEPLGTFYTGEPEDNGGTVTLHGYDALIKAEMPFKTYGTEAWPLSIEKVLNIVAQNIGVTVDSRTEVVRRRMMDYPDEHTNWDILAYIAAAHGGNFILTRQNTLLLLPLNWENGVNHSIGASAFSLVQYSKLDPVSRVVFDKGDGRTYGYGPQTGLTLTAECPIATRGTANDVLEIVGGYEYQGFTCNSARLSPFVNLGDTITVNGFTGVIYETEFTFSKNGFYNVSAPQSQEANKKSYLNQFQNRGVSQEINRVETELSGQIEESASNIYGYVSEEALTVGTGTGATQDVEIASIDYKAGRGSLVAFYCEVKHNTATDETSSVGASTLSDAVLTVSYYINNALADYHPVKTELDGANLLHLIYHFQNAQAINGTVQVVLNVTGGTVTIPAGGVVAHILTQGYTARTGAGSLESIAVTELPLNVVGYTEEPYNFSGLVVTAYYDDGSEKDVTDLCVYSPAHGEMPEEAGEVEVIIEYTEEDTTVDTSFFYTVLEGSRVTDIYVESPPDVTTYYIAPETQG